MNKTTKAAGFLTAFLALAGCATQQQPVPPPPAAAATQAPAPARDARVLDAQAAALAWLALADAGKYADTWAQTTPQFQRAVPKEGWEPALRNVRAPLGALLARKLRSAEFKTSLPGAPDGEYVVIQYDSVFANKAQAVETITPAKNKDGRWEVSGYYLK